MPTATRLTSPFALQDVFYFNAAEGIQNASLQKVRAPPHTRPFPSPLTHSLAHSLTHPLTYSLAHSLTHEGVHVPVQRQHEQGLSR